MRHKLLSLIALVGAMFMSTGAFAQWTAPIKPTLGDNNASAVESGKTYYFKNVGAGQFLAGGGNWATQAMFTWTGMDDTSREALRILVSDSIGTIKGAKVPGLSLKLDGKFNTLGTSNRGAYSVSNTYIFRDSETASFIDHGTQDKGYIWKITKAANGYWRIQTAVEDSNYPNAATQYAGWLNTQGPIAVDAETGELVPFNLDEGIYPYTDVRFDLTEETEGAQIDWMLIEPGEYLQALEDYEVRKELYDALIEASEAGVDAATLNAAGAVYTNASATIEEMQKQKAHLLAAMAGLKYDFSSASDSNPLDVTDQVLVNPTFDENINGWTITVTGQNLQWQKRTDGKVDESKNWVSITNFIEAWRPSSQGGLGDGTISQTVYGLPAGKYILECDAMATRQGGLNGLSAEDAVEGAYIFIEGENGEVRNPIKAPDTQPKHWSVVFISDGSDWLTFGLKAESTTANWLSADNFKLTYYGATTKTQAELELEKAVATAKELKEDDNYRGYVPTLKAFEALIESGQALLDGDKQEESVYQEATEALTAAQDSVKATIAAYAVLYKYFYTELDKYIAIADKMGWEEISEELTDYQEEWEEAYDEGTMTNAEIYTKTDAIYPMLLAAINPDNVEKGTDLTWLLKNPSFDDGTNGWTMTKDGGNTGTVSVDDGVDYKEVEFWRSQFDINQTIANMPAGIYEITVQGFSRNEDDQVNPNSDIKIELYAGNSTAKFMNLLDPNQVRPVEGNEPLWTGANPDKEFEIDGISYYAPNGMGAAAAYFATMNDKTGEPYYTNHVNVTLNKKGDFKIGVRSFNKSEWTLFDNFKITYVGVDAGIYAQLIKEKVEELEKVYASTNEAGEAIYITAEGEKLYQTVKENALTTAVSLTEENATELYPATMETLENAIAYLKAGAEKAEEMRNLIAEYMEVRMSDLEVGADESGFEEYLNEVDEKFNTNGSVESNEAMDAMPEELKFRWNQYVMSFVAENPYDKDSKFGFGNATEAIYNARFESYLFPGTYNTNGWAFEKPDSVGNMFSANFAVGEVYNATSYKVSQTVKGLKPGFYILSVDAFYRPGTSAEITTDSVANIKNVKMFAESNYEGKANVYTQRIKNVMAGAQEAKIAEGIVGESTESTVTIDGQTSYIPLNMEAANEYLSVLDTEDQTLPAIEGARVTSIYRNDLLCGVGEDGILTIGLTNNAKYIVNDWALFSNWTLTYLGSDEPVGVKSAEEKVANGVENIYSLDGIVTKKLQRGVNLIRSAQGVEKVLVP